MSEMVERVALALMASANRSMGFAAKVDYEHAARAAIEAMRSPSGEMLLAGDYSDDGADPEIVNKVWVAMIDAALKP